MRLQTLDDDVNLQVTTTMTSSYSTFSIASLIGRHHQQQDGDHDKRLVTVGDHSNSDVSENDLAEHEKTSLLAADDAAVSAVDYASDNCGGSLHYCAKQ